jgi:hypothetical protein
VRYFDVNALVALGFLEHQFHGRIALWVRSLAKRQRETPFEFIADDHHISRLPYWVKSGGKPPTGIWQSLRSYTIPLLRSWTNGLLRVRRSSLD